MYVCLLLWPTELSFRNNAGMGGVWSPVSLSNRERLGSLASLKHPNWSAWVSVL